MVLRRFTPIHHLGRDRYGRHHARGRHVPPLAHQVEVGSLVSEYRGVVLDWSVYGAGGCEVGGLVWNGGGDEEGYLDLSEFV